jgi:hypothetical protein
LQSGLDSLFPPLTLLLTGNRCKKVPFGLVHGVSSLKLSEGAPS